ncbi:unnamed protein product [Candida verbasci]|uniref:JmjC domain-containing protein n=1 Tax=Candida verbasci TaxID=1227364 RepID=A0A9W4U0Y9_9ASCO|nr:unnamed protein product [Candida verbasci]
MSLKKRQKIKINQYENHTIQKDETIELIEIEPSGGEFFNEYIKIRKPCKFNFSILNSDCFKIDRIVNTLKYDEPLQVEKKINGGFGNGNSRIKMRFSELVDKIKGGNDEFYLTTQYDFDDPDVGDDINDEGTGNQNVSDEVLHDSEGEESIDLKNKNGSCESEYEKGHVSDDEYDDSKEDETNLNELHRSISHSEDEHEDEDEDEHQEGGFESGFNNLSDTSSIDMNYLHDDYEEPDSESEIDINSRIKELFQPPLTNLVHNPEILPLTPSFINLIPQQINLWLGSCNNTNSNNTVLIDGTKSDLGLGKQIPHGNSSGLHHDHADNLYILISGRKRFTIYSPNDALKLFTVGEIYRVYNSGVIDYKYDWKHVRDDGAIIEDVLRWMSDKEKDTSKKADLLQQLEEEIRRNESNQTSNSTDPPSFSKIPPALLHLDELKNPNLRKKLESFANTHFPGFLNLNKCEILLNEGEMLYLPAGYFHEVSSFSDDDNSPHIAINYWFIPPNNNEFNKIYKDDYWKEDWDKTCMDL